MLFFMVDEIPMEMKYLIKIASKIPEKWREFGRFSGFSKDKLDEIMKLYKDFKSPNQQCFTQAILIAPDPLTWEGVIKWLEDINESDLATELEEKFNRANVSQKEYSPKEGTWLVIRACAGL